MIEISKYGVTLRLLDQENLELVRTWRNDPKIRQYLLMRDVISPEQQQKWFLQLDTSVHQYFVIYWKDRKIGLVQITKINHFESTGHPGIFIYEEDHGNTLLAFQAMFVLLDYGFNILGLKKMFAEVLKTNERAIRFNRFFGYELVEGQGDKEYDLYVVTKENCQKASLSFQNVR